MLVGYLGQLVLTRAGRGRDSVENSPLTGSLELSLKLGLSWLPLAKMKEVILKEPKQMKYLIVQYKVNNNNCNTESLIFRKEKHF